MTNFSVHKKTGYINVTPNVPIVINDRNGNVFYDTNTLNTPPYYFNLPMGRYIMVSGNYKKKKYPIKYNLLKLPKRDRNFPIPYNFDIVWDDNPHKCTINWFNKSITFDHILRRYNVPELTFILFHEHGHAKYLSEKGADFYAANQMLNAGFNYSQIGLAHINALSDRQMERKYDIIEEILRVQQ